MRRDWNECELICNYFVNYLINYCEINWNFFISQLYFLFKTWIFKEFLKPFIQAFLCFFSMYFFRCLYKKDWLTNILSFYIYRKRIGQKVSIYDLVYAIDSFLNFCLDHPVCIIVMKLRKINQISLYPSNTVKSLTTNLLIIFM